MRKGFYPLASGAARSEGCGLLVCFMLKITVHEFLNPNTRILEQGMAHSYIREIFEDGFCQCVRLGLKLLVNNRVSNDGMC